MAESASAQIKNALAAQVSPKAIQRAAARALNKAMTSTRAEASRRVREELSLKAGDIKKELTVEKAKASDGLRDMKTTLIVSRTQVDLYKFGARARRVKSSRGPRVGVTVKVKQERKMVAGGFIATMKSGKTAIFRRTGRFKGAKETIGIRLGPKVIDVMKQESVQARLLDYAGKRLEVTFAQELAFEIGKVKG